ncbi:hypothetical protein ACHWQZ_G011827 [Mnemiopsis leidyi]
MRIRTLLSLVFLECLCVLARPGRTGNNFHVPRFGRQFISRYSLLDLGENVCTVTEEVVSLQQNCVDCLKNVSSVLLTNEGSKMYVGAKSLLLSVDMDKCETTNTLPWMGETSSVNCGTQWECGNFITRILDLEGTNLVACGTNYGKPEAIVMKPGLVMLEKRTDLPRICSQSPYWGSSYLQTDSSIFVGVNEDSDISAITRYDVNQRLQLSADRAVTTSELWLNKAKFVSSFEHGDFVYFVMREHVDDTYKATIGRVCKSDPGASHDQSDIEKMFLSFTKTHITCKMSMSSRQTLDFSVIFTATFNSASGQLYATFTQYLDVDIGGYAVCGYSIDDIDASFEGEYLTFNEAGLEVSRPLGSQINCENYRQSSDAWNLYTASSVVTQTTQFPIYYELKKFTTILAETVGRHTVLYVGTNSGTVEKLVITSSNQLVLSTEFVVADSHVQVRSMQFANSRNREMVVSTENTVSKFPVSRCSSHTELDSCIEIQDPHCCWCQTSHSCSHVSECEATECVNDPETGSVSNAFTRLTSYVWEKEEPCVPVCEETEESCTRGEKIIKSMEVYPKISEIKRKTVNCTYTGVWQRTGPVSDNITVVEETTNEARFGTLEDGRLYKILTMLFGSLFVLSLFIIVFLMFYKSRRTSGNNTDSKRKSFADRTNSTNIISDKPISYMTSTKKVENTPMMPINHNMNNSMIMPQDLDKLNNSPYRSHMTAEDERLLQVNIGSRDPTENMYSDVHAAQTLPRNFGNNPTMDRRNPTLPNYSLTLQRQINSNNRFNYNNPPQHEFTRFTPNILS